MSKWFWVVLAIQAGVAVALIVTDEWLALLMLFGWAMAVNQARQLAELNDTVMQQFDELHDLTMRALSGVSDER